MSAIGNATDDSIYYAGRALKRAIEQFGTDSEQAKNEAIVLCNVMGLDSDKEWRKTIEKVAAQD